ncbi:hypothetical protein QJS04_geneDACA023763 [Acorus gramineus]|uniref:Uncharacterized protein n=1 Tax=Acorus gramineus TaxID=55184 RepID=A0AAV9BN44_ACOGR|nr:hypothetical protein QJS04_geneDACA023763 [Acorus gramineus]
MEQRRVKYMERKMSEKCLKKALQCLPVDQLVDHGAQEELHPSIEEPIEHMSVSQRRQRDEQERESRRLRYKRQVAMMTSEERKHVCALRRERRAQMSMAERLRERYRRQERYRERKRIREQDKQDATFKRKCFEIRNVKQEEHEIESGEWRKQLGVDNVERVLMLGRRQKCLVDEEKKERQRELRRMRYRKQMSMMTADELEHMHKFRRQQRAQRSKEQIMREKICRQAKYREKKMKRKQI